VLEIAGDAATRFALTVKQPLPNRFDTTAGALSEGSMFCPTGPFPKESCLWHRLLPCTATRVEDRVTLDVPAGEHSSAYLRARQHNGHMAWASPVFLKRA
jgi:hypothetical protein